MTARQVFCFYIILSAISAQYFVSGDGQESLFSYGTLVDSSSLWSATKVLVAGLMAFLLGSLASKLLFKTVEDRSFYKKDRTSPSLRETSVSPWQILGLASIAVVYIYQFSTAVLENGLPENLAERIFENNFSAIFMVALAYLGYSASLHRNTLLFRGAILTISLFVTVIDGSRSGLIPLLGLLFGALSRKRLLSVFLLIYLIFFGASYAIIARTLDDRLSYDVLYSYMFPDLDLVLAGFRFIIDYVFAFSILHFTYMSFVALPQFGLDQLLISINPLPSYFLDPYVIDSLRFEDRTRAIDGPAELLLVGPIVFYVGFFIWGMLAAYADTVVKSRFKFVVLLMFLLATIIFFQYSLRTSSRMFSAIVFVIFIIRWRIKSIGLRESARIKARIS